MGPVLVTGGLGFTGRHIVRALAANGYKVVSYNRDYSESADPEHVLAVQGELFDIPRLVRAMQEHEVEAVIHTAAMSHPTLSLDFPLATFAANVDGTLGVLEAARLARVRRIVNFSSETVYGRVDGPVTEETRSIRRPRTQ
jgi:UDP-glucose 4-epimerase